MHDLAEAKEVISAILQEAKRKKIKKIKKVFLRVSVKHRHEINVNNLKFNLGLLAEGTIAEGAKFFIKKEKNLSADTFSVIIET